MQLINVFEMLCFYTTPNNHQTSIIMLKTIKISLKSQLN